MFGLVYPPSPAPVIPGATAGRKAPRPAAVEMLPVIDENGIVIAQTSRAYAHSEARPLHPVVHLHILSRYERLCLQKRSMEKEVAPGLWDTAVGGHITYGEQVEEALFREAYEETGLTDFNPIYLRSYLYENAVERELINVFAAVGDFLLRADGDEVTELRWWGFGDIEKNLGKSVFTPNFESEYLRLAKELKALL